MLDPFGCAWKTFATPSSGERHHQHPGWPESTPTVLLREGSRLRLRPLTRRDVQPWRELRISDEAALRPVEPTGWVSWKEAHSEASWRSLFSSLREQAYSGTVVPLVIELNDRFVGQVTVGNIQHGRVSEAWIGYWVHSSSTGRGVATAACALGVDHAFQRIGLHRVTATYLPINYASGRVLAACGFREEGFLRRNLHIDGRWQDHHFVALNTEDYPNRCIERLRAAGRIR